MISDAERTEYEEQLAVAVLLLWLIFQDEFSKSGSVTWDIFYAAFQKHVAPILSYVYGSARNDLANRFGYQYQTRTNTGTAQPTITLPGMARRLLDYAKGLYDSFVARFTAQPQTQPPRPQPQTRPTRPQPSPAPSPQPGNRPPVQPPQGRQPRPQPTAPAPEPEEPDEPEYTEADAGRYSVTTITEATSQGEHDAARDVEANVGKRLVPYWRAQAGACKICAPLNDQPRRVWVRVYPNGPPGHPNCACSLYWRELLT